MFLLPWTFAEAALRIEADFKNTGPGQTYINIDTCQVVVFLITAVKRRPSKISVQQLKFLPLQKTLDKRFCIKFICSQVSWCIAF